MDVKNKKIMITGGLGFLGRNIAKRLMADNEIILFDNMSRSIEYDWMKSGNVQIINGDILDPRSLGSAMKDVDMVMHLAAIAGINTVVMEPVKTIEVDFLGTYHVLKAAKDLNVDRVVVTSTSEVYGPYAYEVDEDENTTQGPVTQSRWGYAVSKLATEHLTFAFQKQYGLNVTTIRPFNIYGPGQKGEGAIRLFVGQAMKNEPITIHGDGTHMRAWCYIDDLVEGFIMATGSKKGINKAFNIGNPRETTTIYGLAKIIKRLANSDSEIIFKEMENYADVYLRVPSIKRARNLLGYVPKVSLEDGLERTLAWYKDNPI